MDRYNNSHDCTRIGLLFKQNMIDDEVLAAGNTDSGSSDKTIDDYFPKENYNGVAIMVEGDKVTSTAVYGYSDYEANKVNNLDTLFSSCFFTKNDDGNVGSKKKFQKEN